MALIDDSYARRVAGLDASKGLEYIGIVVGESRLQCCSGGRPAVLSRSAGGSPGGREAGGRGDGMALWGDVVDPGPFYHLSV